MAKEIKKITGILIFTMLILGFPQMAHSNSVIYDINVQLDTNYYDSSHAPYPYYYHYTVYNSSLSKHALSHWSLFIPCMESGSVDINSISDPGGFGHEPQNFGEQFGEPGSTEKYWGIKWEGTIEPGTSVTCFGFFSSNMPGTLQWKSKGANLWDEDSVGGPCCPCNGNGNGNGGGQVIPEPTTISLLAISLLGLLGFRKKFRQ